MTRTAIPGSVSSFPYSSKEEQGLFSKQDHVDGKSMGFGLRESMLPSLHSPDLQ